MSTFRWRFAGRIDHALVTHLALSPTFAADLCAIAATSAGVRTSRDGGMTWEAEEPVAPRPFVSSVAVGCCGTVVVATGEGVRVSRDWGDTWRDLSGVGAAATVFLRDDMVNVVDAEGNFFSGKLHDLTVHAVSTIPDVPFRVVQAGGSLYALGDQFLISADVGTTWTPVAASLKVLEIADIAAARGRCLALAADGVELWSVTADSIDLVDLPETDCRWTTLASSTSGRTVVLGGNLSVAVSVDAGEHWSVQPVQQSVVSLAVDDHRVGIAAGLADGTVSISRDEGKSWTRSRLTGGTVVTSLVADGHTIRATTVEGTELEAVRAALMLEWQSSTDMADRVDALPEIAGLHGEVATVARDPEGRVVAVGSRSAGGACSVWAPGIDGNWRKLIAHPETARVVALSRSTPFFAAIGDSVYRPWRGGPALASREQVDPRRVREVLAIDVIETAEHVSLVVVLTDAGFYRSDDDGLSWTAFGGPEGPPVTTFTLVDAESGYDVLAAQLGGTLVACRLGDVRRR